MESQAQLAISVFPSQDNTNQTIWIFAQTTRYTTPIYQSAFYGSSIRSSGNYHRRDSWKIDDNLYNNNKPTNAFFNLTPLFGSTNVIDIDSITKRIPGAPPFGQFSENTILFHNVDVTNAPTMMAGSASKTIGGIFMNAGINDQFGIRGAQGGGNLVYTNGQETYWFGSGIMDKPISDFDFVGNLGGGYRYDDLTFSSRYDNAPYFAARQGSTVILRVYSRVIPEPAEYAIVFAVFALGFVFFRHFRKKPSTKFDL